MTNTIPQEPKTCRVCGGRSITTNYSDTGEAFRSCLDHINAVDQLLETANDKYHAALGELEY